MKDRAATALHAEDEALRARVVNLERATVEGSRAQEAAAALAEVGRQLVTTRDLGRVSGVGPGDRDPG